MSLWTRTKAVFSRSPHTPMPGGPSTSQLEHERKRQTAAAWEPQAWDLYRRVPELRAGVNYKANAVSRVRLYLGKQTADGTEPVPVPDEPGNANLYRPMRSLLGGFVEQPGLMRRWSKLLNVAGQAYITAVFPTEEEAGKHGIPQRWIWRILSTRDRGTVSGKDLVLTWFTAAGTRIQRTIKVDASGNVLDIPTDVVYIHDWLSDPECETDPDSAVRGLLEPAETLLNVADSINATAVSRLAMAGIFAVSDDWTVPGVNPDSVPPGADPDMWALMEKSRRNIKNRRSADAQTPLFARSSSDRPPADQMHHQTFASPFDERAESIMERFITRIAVGLDTPVEVISGTQDVNHWNALFVGQDGIRIHIGPEVAHMCQVLTRHWLWRYYRDELKQPGYDEYLIWWDGSALAQDPDRSGTMLSLYQTAPDVLATADEVRRAVGEGPLEQPRPTNRDLPAPRPQQRGTTPIRSLSAPVTVNRRPGFPVRST